jgi:hypothetical protein
MHNRVAYRYLYARLLVALTTNDAKRILGFPPNASPSSEEITKQYKAMVFKNHPDRGGDPKMMVELNVAKDILDGKGRATWQPEAAPPRPAPAPRPRQPPRWEEDPETVNVPGKSFEEALASSGVPAGTVWKFISIPSTFWHKSFYPSDSVWVLYGQTADKHVFLALKRRGESSGTIPTEKWGPKTYLNKDWQSSEVDVPLAMDPLKAIPKNVKLLATSWADGAKPKAPSKFVAWPGGAISERVIERSPGSGGVALKDILLSTGVLNEDHAAVQGRKSVVEIVMKSNGDRYRRMRQEVADGKRKRLDVTDNYDFTVRVDGKAELLHDDTIDNLKKRFIPWVIPWSDIGARTWNLTRMRGGSLKYPASMAIRELANCLTSEPSWLHIALEKAAEQWEEEPAKVASWRALVAHTTSIVDAAYLLDMDPVELFRAI